MQWFSKNMHQGHDLLGCDVFFFDWWGSSVSEYLSALSYTLRELEVFKHFFQKSVPAYQTTQQWIPKEHKCYTQHC